jgi:hypothetical protein
MGPPRPSNFRQVLVQTTCICCFIQLSIDEKHFQFNDGGSPTYILVNTEVYEGDIVEAMPNFLGRMGLVLLAATAIGSLGFIFGSSHVWDR